MLQTPENSQNTRQSKIFKWIGGIVILLIALFFIIGQEKFGCEDQVKKDDSTNMAAKIDSINAALAKAKTDSIAAAREAKKDSLLSSYAAKLDSCCNKKTAKPVQQRKNAAAPAPAPVPITPAAPVQVIQIIKPAPVNSPAEQIASSTQYLPEYYYEVGKTDEIIFCGNFNQKKDLYVPHLWLLAGKYDKELCERNNDRGWNFIIKNTELTDGFVKGKAAVTKSGVFYIDAEIVNNNAPTSTFSFYIKTTANDWNLTPWTLTSDGMFYAYKP
ncbi:MAG: hypothetical protein WC456_04030 [Patescibacteria group bacterium]